jgi:hypothetical protein
MIVCRSCTVELPASRYQEVIERWKQAMINAVDTEDEDERADR